MKKIAIVGLGGVGGYIGALLAYHYHLSESIKICFFARGEHLNAIKKDGLKLVRPGSEIIAHPYVATNNAEEIGVADYIIYCTKSYDVRGGIEQIKSIINQNSVIIPFMNGVDSVEIIREMLPDNEVWDGCVFIISQIIAPGVISDSGTVERYTFGKEHGDIKRMQMFEKICRDAGVNISYNENIKTQIWEKLGYISPLATLTTYSGKSCGEIISSEEYTSLLKKLYHEFISLAKAKGIVLRENIIEHNLKRVAATPKDTTSSMQRDYAAGKKCEVESLTGYIVREAQKYGIEVPMYKKMYLAIIS